MIWLQCLIQCKLQAFEQLVQLPLFEVGFGFSSTECKCAAQYLLFALRYNQKGIVRQEYCYDGFLGDSLWYYFDVIDNLEGQRKFFALLDEMLSTDMTSCEFQAVWNMREKLWVDLNLRQKSLVIALYDKYLGGKDASN